MTGRRGMCEVRRKSRPTAVNLGQSVSQQGETEELNAAQRQMATWHTGSNKSLLPAMAIGDFDVHE